VFRSIDVGYPLFMSDEEDKLTGRTVVVDTSLTTTRSRGVLSVIVGSQTGKVVRLPDVGTTTMGRGPDQDVRFDDGSVSSEHGHIVRVGGTFIFADMKSTNGSYVNDVRVGDPVEIRDGDRIQLGRETILRFTLVSKEEEDALQRVYDAALRDGLTGVFNRKHLEERLDAEISFAARHRTELSLVMLDIDFFKRVNDTLGHPAGDEVLKSVALLLQKAIRNEDLLARYGGEEFTIIVRGIDVQSTALMAERLRVSVEKTPTIIAGRPLNSTVSLGVASLVCCGEQRDRNMLVAIADRRLYFAKHGGRNRVVAQG
jgi:diguanylate cyclase (GGDEF)-like protein